MMLALRRSFSSLAFLRSPWDFYQKKVQARRRHLQRRSSLFHMIEDNVPGVAKPWPSLALALQNGADVNEVNAQGKTMLNELGYASRVVERLLEHGADPNIADHEGRTPLMEAVQNGNDEAVETLLASGACPNAVWRQGLLKTLSSLAACSTVLPSDVSVEVLQALASSDAWDDPLRVERCAMLERTVMREDGLAVPGFSLEPWYIPGTHIDHPVYPALIQALRTRDLVVRTVLMVGISSPSLASLVLNAGADPHAHVDMQGGSENLLHLFAQHARQQRHRHNEEMLRFTHNLLNRGVSPIDQDHEGKYPWERCPVEHRHGAWFDALHHAWEVGMLQQSAAMTMKVAGENVPPRRKRRRL